MKACKNIWLAIVMIFSSLLASAQCFQPKDNGEKFGADSAKCVEYLSLYGEYYKQKNYDMAYKPWQMAVMNCPRSSKNLYIHGPTLIKNAMRNTKDQAQLKLLLDSLMCLYDQRIEFFGQKGYVTNRKAIDMFTITKSSEKAFPMFVEGVGMEGNETEAAALIYYFQSACDMLDKDKITKEQVLEVFEQVTGIIDANLKKTPNDEGYLSAQENVEKIFVTCGGIADCESMIAIFKPQYEEKKGNIDWLKKVANLLDRQKCTDSQLFFDVAKQIHALEPSSFSASLIAGVSIAKGDCSTAIKYLQDAVELEQDAEKKSKYMLGIAKCQASQKNFGAAKSSALKAASIRGGWGEPYISIAEWCAQSAGECGDNECLQKAAFWVAVDYLNKARAVDASCGSEAGKLISRYSQYFPNNETCFFHGLKEGDEVQVGCWINEKTKVRF
ncbi:MAG: hypothetical protein H6585_12560 [Flavobacteriales bacterium]|nr:hypothetical protein [Flavobacteriales bacterium]MCB9449162.1 hypothetical protein [Flavobacteriales bacterium]